MFDDVTPGGVLTGLIVSAVGWLILSGIKAYKRWRIQDEIETLELERKHLEEIKKSSTALNRSAFRGIFFGLMLIGIASAAGVILPLLQIAHGVIAGLVVICWLFLAMLGFVFFQRYKKLSNFAEAMKDIEDRTEKLKSKLTHI